MVTRTWCSNPEIDPPEFGVVADDLEVSHQRTRTPLMWIMTKTRFWRAMFVLGVAIDLPPGSIRSRDIGICIPGCLPAAWPDYIVMRKQNTRFLHLHRGRAGLDREKVVFPDFHLRDLVLSPASM